MSATLGPKMARRDVHPLRSRRISKVFWPLSPTHSLGIVDRLRIDAVLVQVQEDVAFAVHAHVVQQEQVDVVGVGAEEVDSRVLTM